MTMIGAMSGHNRWSKIKHKKEASDSKKSKMWTKLIKELTVSARFGGGDVNGNPRLRTAVDKARLRNMPNDTIDRAIKKGTGDLEGVSYEEFNYEVFGPGGIAVLVEIMTDNRNRTAGEVRSVITRHGGNLGASGSVSYMFKKQGLVVYEAATVNEDKVTELAIELGADDVRTEGESLIVVTDPKSFEAVREGLEEGRAAGAALGRGHHGPAERQEAGRQGGRERGQAGAPLWRTTTTCRTSTRTWTSTSPCWRASAERADGAGRDLATRFVPRGGSRSRHRPRNAAARVRRGRVRGRRRGARLRRVWRHLGPRARCSFGAPGRDRPRPARADR